MSLINPAGKFKAPGRKKPEFNRYNFYQLLLCGQIIKIKAFTLDT